jgi:hypothetical protein
MRPAHQVVEARDATRGLVELVRERRPRGTEGTHVRRVVGDRTVEALQPLLHEQRVGLGSSGVEVDVDVDRVVEERVKFCLQSQRLALGLGVVHVDVGRDLAEDFPQLDRKPSRFCPRPRGVDLDARHRGRVARVLRPHPLLFEALNLLERVEVRARHPGALVPEGALARGLLVGSTAVVEPRLLLLPGLLIAEVHPQSGQLLLGLRVLPVLRRTSSVAVLFCPPRLLLGVLLHLREVDLEVGKLLATPGLLFEAVHLGLVTGLRVTPLHLGQARGQVELLLALTDGLSRRSLTL